MIGKRDPFLGISKRLSTDEVAVLDLRGVLDDGSGAALIDYVDTLASGGVRRVILDLTALYLVDEPGFGALVTVDERLRSASGSLKIRNPSHQVRSVIESNRTARRIR